MSSQVLPELWHFRVSHFNEKARWALDYKQIPHLRHSVIAGFHIPVARRLSGQNMLPILRLGGSTLHGSDCILSALEQTYPEPRLFPEDPKQRERAIEIQAYFDTEVAPSLRRVFWSTYIVHPSLCAKMATDGFGPVVRWLWRVTFPLALPLYRRNMGLYDEQITQAYKNIRGYFDYLEREIGSSGYLVGDCFGVADLTAAAVMTAIIRPPEFSYPLPEPWSEELRELRESIARYPACDWVLDIYKKHRGTSFEVTKQQIAAAGA